MAEEFRRFDAADYLRTEADIDAYLDAASDHPAALVAALGAVARARNMSELARSAGLTREGVYKATSPDGNPSFATVAKIAGALGFRINFSRIRDTGDQDEMTPVDASGEPRRR